MNPSSRLWGKSQANVCLRGAWKLGTFNFLTFYSTVTTWKRPRKGHGKVIEFHSWISVWTMLAAVVCHMMDHVEVIWFIEMIKIFSFRDLVYLILGVWQCWVCYYADYTLFMHTSLTTKSDGHDWQLLSDTWWTKDHVEVIWFMEMIKIFSIHPTLNQYVSKMCYYTEMEMSFWQNFSSLTTLEVVKMTTSGAASDDKFCQNDDISNLIFTNAGLFRGHLIHRGGGGGGGGGWKILLTLPHWSRMSLK